MGRGYSELNKEQYKTPGKLEARMSIYDFQLKGGRLGWPRWVFEKIILKGSGLELGCGPAIFWQANSDRLPEGFQVILSDNSKGMLLTAKNQLMAGADIFSFQEIDAQEPLPFADKIFDFAMAFHMLYHVEDIEKTIKEVWRVLKKGGVFYSSGPSFNHLQEIRELGKSF